MNKIKNWIDYHNMVDNELGNIKNIEDSYVYKLQKENKNLKEIEKEHHKLNGDLRKELKQRDEVIDEAIYLLKFGGIDSYVNSVEKTHEFRDKVVNILQKYKGDNNG